jgi:maltose-binding protein MalE
MRRFLIITTFLLALVMLIKTEPQTQAFPQESTKTLYVWGIDDLSDEVSQAALRFQREYPDTSVEYKRFRDRQEYYEVLLHELERQKGPDLILFSESNREDLSHFLVPFAAQNTSQFPAMVEEELLQDGQVLGLPITTESLVMFYNAEHFGENYPQTWDDIAVRSENFKIGGVAIGELSSIRSGWRR